MRAARAAATFGRGGVSQPLGGTMRVRTHEAIACAAILVGMIVCTPAYASTSVTQVYDDYSDGGASFATKWAQTYGPLELAAGGTQSFAGNKETVQATPFTVGADFSVFDHLKYF